MILFPCTDVTIKSGLTAYGSHSMELPGTDTDGLTCPQIVDEATWEQRFYSMKRWMKTSISHEGNQQNLLKNQLD